MKLKIGMGLTAAVLVSYVVSAQESGSVWDGIYTEDQAKRGETLYQQKCASCHGEAFEGAGQAPMLTGDEFKAGWNGQTVGDLFEKMQTTMPADSPGTLSKEDNADLLAFMLKRNQFPVGERDLAPDIEAMKKIRFEAVKPQK